MAGARPEQYADIPRQSPPRHAGSSIANTVLAQNPRDLVRHQPRAHHRIVSCRNPELESRTRRIRYGTRITQITYGTRITRITPGIVLVAQTIRVIRVP